MSWKYGEKNLRHTFTCHTFCVATHIFLPYVMTYFVSDTFLCHTFFLRHNMFFPHILCFFLKILFCQSFFINLNLSHNFNCFSTKKSHLSVSILIFVVPPLTVMNRLYSTSFCRLSQEQNYKGIKYYIFLERSLNLRFILHIINSH